MDFQTTSIQDLQILEMDYISDERGSFYRLFCDRELQEVLDGKTIVQINHSMTTTPGSIRGLHFQYPPSSEIKIVRCIRGAVFDVALDLRSNSNSMLRWHGERLSADDNLALIIPQGFAHGFQSLEPNSELLYLHSAHYDPGAEGGVRYNDPSVAIEWPIEISNVSERDRSHPLIKADFAGISL